MSIAQRPNLPSPGEPAKNPTLPLNRLAAYAAACLMIDDARTYGLIDTDPQVNRARCSEVLALAKAKGIVPSQDEIEQAALGLMAAIGVVRG